MIVARLEPIEVAEVVDVLADAFRDYPVMRFVLGAGRSRRAAVVRARARGDVGRTGRRRALVGQGIGRRLLDAVHAHSRADPGSAGVALGTEDPANVPLYEHVGYRVLGRERVAPALETFALWRPDDA